MSRPHRGGFESWLRGGQTVGHTFDMTIEVLGKLLLLVVAPLTLIIGWVAVHRLSPNEQLARHGVDRRSSCARDDRPAAHSSNSRSNRLDGSGARRQCPRCRQGPRRRALCSRVLANGELHPDPLGLPDAARRRGRQSLVPALGAGTRSRARQIRGQIVQPLSRLLAQIRAFNVAEAKATGRHRLSGAAALRVPHPFRNRARAHLDRRGSGVGPSPWPSMG